MVLEQLENLFILEKTENVNFCQRLKEYLLFFFVESCHLFTDSIWKSGHCVAVLSRRKCLYPSGTATEWIWIPRDRISQIFKRHL